MCCNTADWKREIVPDHKFDFIDIESFHSVTWATRLQYVWLYLLVIKSGAVYIADIYTAVALLASNHWSGEILQAASKSGHGSSTLEVPFNIGKWIFTGCIIFSFLLLLWEARKSRAIVRSRDISFAYTNVMSQNWYSLRSYDTFCLFMQINSSTKVKDELTFFVFFTFKGWLRLILADGPRAAINGITLYSFGKAANWTTDLSVYFGGSFLKAGIVITMLFTLVIWVGSILLLIIATLMYIPLLCYIQGNLKEYVCHKVDKRIAELMKRKTRKRLAKEAEIARKEAKTGKFSLPQPTLPKIGLKDDDLYAPSYAGSEVGGSSRGGTRNGGSRKGGAGIGGGNQYQYPPPSSSSAFGGGSEWDRDQKQPYNNSQSNAGVGTLAGSNLSRSAYPYASSDQSLNQHPGTGGNYAESATSFDDLASRGAAMGYDSYPAGLGGGRNSYNGGGGGGDGRLGGGVGSNGRSRLSESQAPSYHSEDEKLGYIDEYLNDTTSRPGNNFRDSAYGAYNNNSNNNPSFTTQQRSHDPYFQTQSQSQSQYPSSHDPYSQQQHSQHDPYYSQQDSQQPQHSQNSQHLQQQQYEDYEYEYETDSHPQSQVQNQNSNPYDQYHHQPQFDSTGMTRNHSDGSTGDMIAGYGGGGRGGGGGGWEEGEGRNFEPDHRYNGGGGGGSSTRNIGTGGSTGGGSGRAR